jgi:hypothetical protein
MIESDLLTSDESAQRLRMSRRTFDGHVANGDISYIVVGLGLKRSRKRFDPADLDRFQEKQRRTACRSTNVKARKRTPTVFRSEVVDFQALLEQRRAAKRNGPKHANAR